MDIRSSGYRFWTSYQVEGNAARITGHSERSQEDALLTRNTEFSLRFYSRGGPVTLGTKAHTRALQTTSARLIGAPGNPAPTAPSRTFGSNRIPLARVDDGGFHNPWDDWDRGDTPPIGPIGPPLPPGGGGGGGGVGHAAIKVQLFAPGMSEPVQVWNLPEQHNVDTIRTVEFNPQGIPAPNAPILRAGWWQCTLTPTGPDPVSVYLAANADFALQPFRTQTFGTRLFNSVFRVALEALVPIVYVEGSKLKVNIGKELAEAYGLTPIIVTKDLPSGLSSNARLSSLRINAVSGKFVKDKANENHRHPAQLARIEDDDVALWVQAAFDKASATAYGFDLARLNGELGELFLAFDKSFTRCTPVSFVSVDFSTLADWLITIAQALFEEINHDVVNTAIEALLTNVERPLCTYLQEVLSRAAGQRAVADRLYFAGGNWQLRCFDEPAFPDENLPWHPPFGGGAGGPVHSTGTAGTVVLPSDPTPAGSEPGGTTPAAAPAIDPVGVFPPEVVVAGGAALERLDRHQSILVIMMENRSYDHLLGGLAAAHPSTSPDRDYDGPPAGAGNPPAGGFDAKIPVTKATAIGIGTATPVCPHHDFESVRFQIGDGTLDTGDTGGMQGFTRSVMDRTDSPQIVMMQYQASELPTYYRLADYFMVCTRWFAAHAGPTWPNRYATVTGSIPDLNNFDSNDPRIGFLKDRTIFDALSEAGIEWRIFESDLSLIRTFDRYRLDDRRVVWIDDPNDGLEAVLRSDAPLPRVMFIEPNFSDIPPLNTASDDLAPTDLAHGQAFISHICDLIWHYRKFNQCMLVITYDEHGGFYDHVPPPGTAKGDPALVDSFPKLHPAGPQHLGVRVPAFIISPFVNSNTDSHIFDHTSILKTILVHNRERLRSSVLGSFGPRVAKANHLGVALNLATPREPPVLFATMHASAPATLPTDGRPLGAVTVLPASAAVSNVPAGQPGPLPRTITFVPRSGLEGSELGDRGDFHVALRDMLRPRR